MTIEHIIINGNGPFALTNYGVLEILEKNYFYNIKNIKTIYGTSSGSMLGLILCLKYDWDELNNFLIKRPWEKIFNIKIENLYDFIDKNGLLDREIFVNIFKPLLLGKDLNVDITLKEFYEYSKIELHLMTVDINTSNVINLSYKNYPDLLLIDAIHMSSCIPGVITPVFLDDMCLIDGGLFCNYPVNFCIKDQMCDKNTILGIKNIWENDNCNINNNNINQDSNLSLIHI